MRILGSSRGSSCLACFKGLTVQILQGFWAKGYLGCTVKAPRIVFCNSFFPLHNKSGKYQLYKKSSIYILRFRVLAQTTPGKLTPGIRSELNPINILRVPTWSPKVCRIIAFWAIFRISGLLSYLFGVQVLQNLRSRVPLSSWAAARALAP